jgi:DNA-binding winged helix-turn-helix (wHTH) protein
LRYLFEDFALDTDLRELRRQERVVTVEPQVFDLLVYLVRHRARLVTKDDLFRSIWHGRIVSESALTTRINAARAAVGDSGHEQRLIRTLRGHGFRFMGDVREPVAAAAEDHISATIPPAILDRPSIAMLPFANLTGDPGQNTSRTAWSTTFFRRCRACRGCS